MPILIVDGMSVLLTLAGAAAHLDRGYAYNFLTQVTAAVKKVKADGVLVCWEGGFQKRSELLPGYKTNRNPTPAPIVEERTYLKSLLTALGADQFYAPGHEADDVIAYLANTLNTECVILSADKDLLQLVGPNVSVYQKVRKAGLKSKREIINIGNFAEKTGWATPEIFLKAHCAMGDAVDCIPKLAGVGDAVVHAYFMGMEIPAGKKAKLDQFYADSEQYVLNRKLICLTDLTELECVRTPGRWSLGESYGLLEEMGFASITGKFQEWILPWQRARLDADVPTTT